MAYAGENAYTILEMAYANGLVALFVPFCFGLFNKLGDHRSALASMFGGFAVWSLDLFWDFEFEITLLATLTAGIVYVVSAKVFRPAQA